MLTVLDLKLPRRFYTERTVDVSGVSGTGVVAFGVMFPDGTTVLRWNTETASTAIYNSIHELEAIHGHGGSTTIHWLD